MEDEQFDIQAAIETSLHRRSIEAAIHGEVAPSVAGENEAPHLAVFRSITSEMHSLLDNLAEDPLPIYFGRHLGELKLTFPR